MPCAKSICTGKHIAVGLCNHTVEMLTNDLDLLSVPNSKHKNIGDRLFAYGAVVEWNKLPLELRHSSSVNVFKIKVKNVFV